MANRQRNSREVSLLLVFVMLCTQLILAQHATVHFIEDEHIGYAYQHENKQESPVDHPGHNKDKVCQICLFSKALSHTFLSAGVDVLAPDFAAAFAVPVPRDAYARIITLPLRARGPPFLLS